MSFSKHFIARTALLAFVAPIALASPGFAADDATKAQRRAAILDQLRALQLELQALDATDTASPASGSPARPAVLSASDILVTAVQPQPYDKPVGQTVSSVDESLLANVRGASVTELMQSLPGVTVQQNNGPRDSSISIRGSNVRGSFGIRNILVFEDGFPVTQPDGLSRTDLTDPHAYAGIDVYRGPSSALFGNYASGGAINFRTRPGASINGFEAGLDAGSYGYRNGYATLGGKSGGFVYSLFGSHVRGDGFVNHSAYRTTTANLLVSYAPNPDNKLTFKFINNDLDADTPVRLTLNQFSQNPFQKGCEVAGAAATAAGCANVNLFANGANGTRVALSPDQAGVGRHDRRTIAGARWEHALDSASSLRVQGVFDNKDISQPTGATSARGPEPAFNVTTDVTRVGTLGDLPATHYAGLYFSYADLNNQSFNVAPGGRATLGALVSQTSGRHYNYGGRLREEVRLADGLTGVLGVAVEGTRLEATQFAYAYPAAASPTTAITPALRSYVNVAPEAALIYAPNTEWEIRARASTGYGTPQVGNLFVTPQGVPGNNTDLKSQRNLGFDLGADWRPVDGLLLSATGFYEFFRNELVSQSPGVSLLSYTFNAPRSEHRGVELAADWQVLPEWRLSAAYTYMNQIYTRYTERLTAGTFSTAFDRAGNRIPGVVPNYVNARVAWDRDLTPSQRLGFFVEFKWSDTYTIDNAMLMKAPGYRLFNANLHYDLQTPGSLFEGIHLYVQVDNLFDRVYAASAAVISNSLNATTGALNPASVIAGASGSFYAGQPRSVSAGVRAKF